MGSGGPTGLQNQLARLIPGWVGSIPTRSRQIGWQAPGRGGPSSGACRLSVSLDGVPTSSLPSEAGPGACPSHEDDVSAVSGSVRIQVILNPAASGGRGAGLRAGIEEALSERGVGFSITETEAPGHALHLGRRMSREGMDRILVVGGDGTVHEVANGVLEEETHDPPVLGVVPVGTGNDFFRMVGSARGIRETVRTFLEGEVRRFDVGRVRWGDNATCFVNLLGVGVDVTVLEKREGFTHFRGLPQYLAAFASALASFRPEAYRVVVAGHGKRPETFDRRTILTTVTVGPSIGGGFMVNPTASPFDGLLDLFSVEAVGLGKIVRFVPRVIRGTHGGIREIELRTFARGTIERSDGEPFHFELDGERMPDATSRLEIDVLPGALPVAVAGGRQ